MHHNQKPQLATLAEFELLERWLQDWYYTNARQSRKWCAAAAKHILYSEPYDVHTCDTRLEMIARVAPPGNKLADKLVRKWLEMKYKFYQQGNLDKGNDDADE